MRRSKASKDIDPSVYFNHQKPWTEKENILLDELSDFLPDEEISKKLGRTIPSIWNQRMKLDRAKAQEGVDFCGK